MTPTYQLVAMDLDGTLVGEDLSLSPRVRRALARAARGIRLTLASGRGYPALRPWAQELGLTTPLICYQGAIVADPLHGTILYRRTFPQALVREVNAWARQRDLSLTFYADDAIYVERKRHTDAFYAKWFGLPYHLVTDLPKELPAEPVKFIIIGEGAELDALQPELERDFQGRLQIVRSHRFFLEGLAPGVSKGSALAWLAERLGIPRQAVMAIGDSGNDREMIAWAGLGVAMGNASPEAKEVADYVAPSVEHDGAAEALERFCLEGRDDGKDGA